MKVGIGVSARSPVPGLVWRTLPPSYLAWGAFDPFRGEVFDEDDEDDEEDLAAFEVDEDVCAVPLRLLAAPPPFLLLAPVLAGI